MALTDNLTIGDVQSQCLSIFEYGSAVLIVSVQ